MSFSSTVKAYPFAAVQNVGGIAECPTRTISSIEPIIMEKMVSVKTYTRTRMVIKPITLYLNSQDHV